MSVIYQNKCLIAPGEAWDRITILELKILNLRPKFQEESNGTRNKKTMSDQLTAMGSEWARMNAVLVAYEDELHGARNKADLVYYVDRLRAQNLHQWNCEDRVRVEESWEAAKAARDSNTLRTEIKNKINEIYGHDEEYKNYAGE